MLYKSDSVEFGKRQCRSYRYHFLAPSIDIWLPFSFNSANKIALFFIIRTTTKLQLVKILRYLWKFPLFEIIHYSCETRFFFIFELFFEKYILTTVSCGILTMNNFLLFSIKWRKIDPSIYNRSMDVMMVLWKHIMIKKIIKINTC